MNEGCILRCRDHDPDGQTSPRAITTFRMLRADDERDRDRSVIWIEMGMELVAVRAKRDLEKDQIRRSMILKMIERADGAFHLDWRDPIRCQNLYGRFGQ